MGTLGCINDMLQRDKKPPELRKSQPKRPKGNPKQAQRKSGAVPTTDTSVEEMKEIEKKRLEKEKADANHLSKIKLLLAIFVLFVLLSVWAVLFSHQIRSHLSPPTVLTVKVSSSVPLPRPSFRRTLNTASPVHNFGEACTMTL